MASTRRRISLIVGMAVAAAWLALPAFAEATVYCVDDTPGDLTNNNSIDPSCQTAIDTIPNAFSAATASTAVADTVRIGPGNYNVPQVNYSGQGANSVDVIGSGESGPGSTTWTMTNTAGSTTALSLDNPAGVAATASDFTISIPDDGDLSGDLGMNNFGDTTITHVTVSGPATNNTTGLFVHGPNLIDHVTISLNQSSPDGNTGIVSQGTPTIVDSTIDAQNGITHGGAGQTFTVRRSVIKSGTRAVAWDSGTGDLSSTIIDLLGSSADAIVPTNFNPGVSPINATVDGVTIVNGGAGSNGIRILASSGPDDTTNNGETVTANVANTVISGVTHPFNVAADRGEIATVTSSYSNYDPTGNLSTNNFDGAGAVGTLTFTEPNQTNLAPDFVNPGAGNYHLLSSSALIDIGDPAHPAPGAQDIDGDSREIFGKNGCDGARRDIGADEFDPSTPPTLLDCVPPDTNITSGPTGRTSDNTPTFTFDSTEASSTFQCSVDGAAFAACGAPFTTPALGDGPHSIAVKAIDSALNEDASPATRTFSIDTTGPDTSVTGKRKVKTRKKKARVTWTFGSSEPGPFQCSLDGAPFAPCSSPFSVKLRLGAHTLSVRGTDTVGNTDPTPISFTTKVKRRK